MRLKIRVMKKIQSSLEGQKCHHGVGVKCMFSCVQFSQTVYNDWYHYEKK